MIRVAALHIYKWWPSGIFVLFVFVFGKTFLIETFLMLRYSCSLQLFFTIYSSQDGRMDGGCFEFLSWLCDNELNLKIQSELTLFPQIILFSFL